MLDSPRATDDNAMKSIKQLQAEEDERRRVFAEKIKQLKANEANRLAKIAKQVKLIDYAITDAELTAGFLHAIELSVEREKQQHIGDDSSTSSPTTSEPAAEQHAVSV